MKRLIMMAICFLFVAGCGGETPNGSAAIGDEGTVASAETTKLPDVSEAPEEGKQEGKESMHMSSIPLQDILDYFAAENDFTPAEGFDRKHDNAEYGEVFEIEYYSETTGTMRKANIYTPPDFDTETTYPVLYLLHGIGGTHTEWNGGRPNEILSNLLATGEAPPMIAVMPNVRATADDGIPSDMFSPEHIAAFGNFIHDLRADLMPFIRENYPVSEKREDTALAGLSMGGREALNIAARMPEAFGYIGAFAPAPGLMSALHDTDAQLTDAEITAIPDEYKRNIFVLINTGNQDGVVGGNPLMYHNAFVNNGIESVFYTIDGGHDFNVWKNGLYYFAKNIFRIDEREDDQ
ncbi:MAG: alpha/beta hydrolase-fold protein [Oscillospiraceae bacterium]|nr:alpha/beta hydrolase-fold protein [Oscillospiraceae bacterium]